MFIESVLKATQGKFFTVVFVKKDGTTRVMNARLGVSKHLKGGQSTLDSAQYLTVYDMQAEGYRAVNLSTIISVTCGGVTLVNTWALNTFYKHATPTAGIDLALQTIQAC